MEVPPMQDPLTQASAGPQETPQPPQFCGSDWVFTQTLAHSWVPPGQTQAPALQVWSARQPGPQVPPQPSGPHCFWLQSGVQVQSAHLTPAGSQPQAQASMTSPGLPQLSTQ